MLTETQRKIRGHRFYPPKALARKIPALRATDGQADAATVWLHYFVRSADWYITELDPTTGEAFGWAELSPGMGEWGYVSLPELELLRIGGYTVVERDCYWEPVPMRQALAQRAA